MLKHTTASERVKYDEVWLDPAYRTACHSLKLWQERRELFPSSFSSALDIGCGLGLIINEWLKLGVDAWGIDISRNSLHPSVRSDVVVVGCLWEVGWDKRFDFGVCTDVMEHIPPDRVSDTLARIFDCCDEVLFKIAHVSDQMGGGTLHLTVKDREWWLAVMQRANPGGKTEFLGVEMRSGYEDSLIRWTREWTKDE